MKRISIFLLLLSLANFSFGQEKISVFNAGSEGYKCFRIPAIIKAANGDLLAFAEGRVNGTSDFGNIDVVMKRSTDRGKTWGPLKVVVNNDTLQAGNPAPVLDSRLSKSKKQRLYLFYNTGNKSEDEIRAGNGQREAWYKISINNGLTWGNAINITSKVHKPSKTKLNAQNNNSEDWRWIANLPGHAMQFKQGKYKGRIFVAANHSKGNPRKQMTDVFAFGYYTDDRGKTFKIGKDILIPGSSESMAAELSNNKLMMNSRNQKYDVKQRIVSISSDGGASWDTTYYDKNLIDPVCQGSLLDLGILNGKKTLAFCNPSNHNLRDNLTLRTSDDDGKTWTKGIVVDKSSNALKDNQTAYSDLVDLSESNVGVLYERNNYTEIIFTIINLK